MTTSAAFSQSADVVSRADERDARAGQSLEGGSVGPVADEHELGVRDALDDRVPGAEEDVLALLLAESADADGERRAPEPEPSPRGEAVFLGALGEDVQVDPGQGDAPGRVEGLGAAPALGLAHADDRVGPARGVALPRDRRASHRPVDGLERPGMGGEDRRARAADGEAPDEPGLGRVEVDDLGVEAAHDSRRGGSSRSGCSGRASAAPSRGRARRPSPRAAARGRRRAGSRPRPSSRARAGRGRGSRRSAARRRPAAPRRGGRRAGSETRERARARGRARRPPRRPRSGLRRESASRQSSLRRRRARGVRARIQRSSRSDQFSM